MAQTIPEYLQVLFWDTGANFDPTEYPEYTIFRILELGDQRAVAWLRATFSKQQIVNVIRGERRMSRKSANFWALVYGIAEGEVAALR
jgi:hypothetical protein